MNGIRGRGAPHPARRARGRARSRLGARHLPSCDCAARRAAAAGPPGRLRATSFVAAGRSRCRRQGGLSEQTRTTRRQRRPRLCPGAPPRARARGTPYARCGGGGGGGDHDDAGRRRTARLGGNHGAGGGPGRSAEARPGTGRWRGEIGPESGRSVPGAARSVRRSRPGRPAAAAATTRRARRRRVGHGRCGGEPAGGRQDPHSWASRSCCGSGAPPPRRAAISECAGRPARARSGPFAGARRRDAGAAPGPAGPGPARKTRPGPLRAHEPPSHGPGDREAADPRARARGLRRRVSGRPACGPPLSAPPPFVLPRPRASTRRPRRPPVARRGATLGRMLAGRGRTPPPPPNPHPTPACAPPSLPTPHAARARFVGAASRAHVNTGRGRGTARP